MSSQCADSLASSKDRRPTPLRCILFMYSGDARDIKKAKERKSTILVLRLRAPRSRDRPTATPLFAGQSIQRAKSVTVATGGPDTYINSTRTQEL